MSIEVMSTGDVKPAFLEASLLERAGIQTSLVLEDDDLFGGDLYCIHVDAAHEQAARQIVERSEGASMQIGDNGALSYTA
jgi:hypothetical protein